ncbi:MAG TPA: sugar phosphate nucleotidyltransferase [Acidimicrobiales bacterium]|nr:sugar phosphate nucleotidyltransferase [Acidimicrobiales bacterium]
MSRPASGGNRRGATLVVLAAGRATRYGGVKPLAPVGVMGEAILDLLVSDALAAGFERIVLVIGPETGPAIEYHVARTWPSGVPVELAFQASPRGTVDAVLAAAQLLDEDSPFGVANADDLPGEAGLALLAGHVRGGTGPNAAICYRLRDSLLGDAPVTRGLCSVDDEGMLVAVDERRLVAPVPEGRILAGDGRTPEVLDPDQLVSINLWGFAPEMLDLFGAAMATSGGGTEVLLPVVVDELLAARRAGVTGAAGVRVIRAPGRCLGVTHPGDVALVQAELSREVGRGDRPAQLWSTLFAGRS